ncbi:MAG: FadR/GntR family transcriptional regulator [Bacillota bacterium]
MKETGWNSLVPVRSRGLYKQVEDQFIALIGSGQLRPGDKLPSERELQEQLQVSRAVLREALRMLEAKGLIVGSQGKGRYLRAVTASGDQAGAASWTRLEQVSLSDIYEIRLLIEPAGAGWAAVRRTDADLAQMRTLLDRMRQSQRLWHEEDFPFHLAVAAASQNQMAVRILRMQYDLMNKYSQNVYRRLLEEESMDQWVREHEQIVEAIAARDQARAAEWMHQHITRAYTLLQET